LGTSLREQLQYNISIQIRSCIIIYHIHINIFIISKYVIKKVCQATGNVDSHNKSEFISDIWSCDNEKEIVFKKTNWKDIIS